MPQQYAAVARASAILQRIGEATTTHTNYTVRGKCTSSSSHVRTSEVKRLAFEGGAGKAHVQRSVKMAASKTVGIVIRVVMGVGGKGRGKKGNQTVLG